jgi:hypothetical protein
MSCVEQPLWRRFDAQKEPYVAFFKRFEECNLF